MPGSNFWRRTSENSVKAKFGSLSLHPPLLKIPIPLATSRCEPSEGTFCTVTSCSPGSRATRVEEPPPSRLRASSAPSFRIISATSFVLRPTLFAERPSTVTRYSLRPSRLAPAAVRGASAGSPSPTCGTTPSRKSIGFPPMANSRSPPSCEESSDRIVTCSPGWSFSLNCSAPPGFAPQTRCGLLQGSLSGSRRS